MGDLAEQPIQYHHPVDPFATSVHLGHVVIIARYSFNHLCHISMKSNVELLAIACEDGTQLFRQFLGQTDLPSDHTENDLASTELYPLIRKFAFLCNV